MLSNGLVGLGGSVFAQSQGVADVSLGIGTVVVGLAAVIIGEALLGKSRIWRATLGCLVGAALYRLLVAVALGAGALGLQAQDLNLVTAVVVGVAVYASRVRQAAHGRIRNWITTRLRTREIQSGL
jgi:putative ABC transport system permease protein